MTTGGGGASRARPRVLVAGWPSFTDGVATAGDVLAMEAVAAALAEAEIGCELAWSPVLRPQGLTLEQAAPCRYTHLVFACGPVHGPLVAGLHDRYRACTRIAVGVSVVDPADPAVAGFDVVLPRDAPGAGPQRDLSAQAPVAPVPVAGIVLADAQPEYGTVQAGSAVTAGLSRWLTGLDCARVPLDTRLEARDWAHCATPGQFESVIRRLDVVVTTRLHGLVLALKNGVPVLAVDPVPGGAKVTAQARAWDWPVLTAGEGGGPGPASLDRLWSWCLSAEGVSRARAAAEKNWQPALTRSLLAALRLSTEPAGSRACVLHRELRKGKEP
jgi:Polysaccharide pyruvyl transferase